jgi:hypothetical protein
MIPSLPRCPGSGKFRYPSRHAAGVGMNEVIELNRKNGRKNGALRVYRCADCGCWHFGHLKATEVPRNHRAIDEKWQAIRAQTGRYY